MDTRICRLHAAHDLRVETQPVPELAPDEVQVAIGAGGICGSDLHYYHDGGIGQIRVREPIIVGHEAAGHITQVGANVTDLAAGDLVAINPSLPCGNCEFCARNEFNHCINMRFMGSAYRLPHEQGMFRDLVNIPAVRALKFSNAIPVQKAACSEPLAVCLHAASHATEIDGARVLVTGAGPIGCLMTAVAAQSKPAELVVTDLNDFPLSAASKMGASETVNVAQNPEQMDRFHANKGTFDIVFECTGAAPAIRDALEMLRPGGTMVLVGVAGEISLALNVIVSKEIKMVGTHRFHPEFAEAVRLIDNEEIDVSPIVSHSFDADQAVKAFDLAGDRTQAIKVHLTFGEGQNA